jgi:hypothetical protein
MKGTGLFQNPLGSLYHKPVSRARAIRDIPRTHFGFPQREAGAGWRNLPKRDRGVHRYRCYRGGLIIMVFFR